MKCSLLFSLFLMIVLPLSLHSETITGKLVDQNGKGLSGLSLKLYTSQQVDSAVSSDDGSFTFNNLTGVKDLQLPAGYSVSANYPNPFNPKTRIEITLPDNGIVNVEVYNQIGQKVRPDINKYFPAGNNYIDLELNGLANGFYIAQITVDGKYKVVRKLMLVYGSQHLLSSAGSNSGVSKTNPSRSFKLSTPLDSLVVTSHVIGKKIFLNLPSMTGISLDLGNLIIERFCSGMPTVSYSGKTYNTVQIGAQCWLKENLDVGTRINGSIEPTNNGTIEKYCYNDDTANCTKYGGLYSWYEAMQYDVTPEAKGICPNGWHIPTNVELQALSSTVNYDGNALKSVGEGTGNGAGTNKSDFSVFLAGLRNSNGTFSDIGDYPYIWTSSIFDPSFAYYMLMYYNNNSIGFYSYRSSSGCSVRCLMD